jgi:hypothetical protein
MAVNYQADLQYVNTVKQIQRLEGLPSTPAHEREIKALEQRLAKLVGKGVNPNTAQSELDSRARAIQTGQAAGLSKHDSLVQAGLLPSDVPTASSSANTRMQGAGMGNADMGFMGGGGSIEAESEGGFLSNPIVLIGLGLAAVFLLRRR